MTDLSNAQLSGQMSALLVSWQAREDQYRAWTGGTANGGPNADGRYQLTDSAGITRLVECPALLASTVSGPAAAALAHKLETIVARDVSISEATRAAAQRVLAEAALAAAVLARNQAQLARDVAQNAESNAAVHAGTASVAASSSTAAYLGTQADREATTADAAAADADRILAQAAATAAAADRAAINPVQFATRADGLSQIVGLQAALDAKLPSASFTWSGLAGKPSTFAPSAHSHVIADTTGLQAALDAKLATSSFTWSSLPGKPTEFAVAAHVHDASAVTSGVFDIDRIPILPSQVQQMSSGDLTALTGPQQTAIKSGTIVTTTDGSRYVYSGTGSKTSAASYVLLADVTPDWNTISGKPSTYAPSAHSHVVADVTGLQAALDGKQAAGSYAASAHSHVIADTTGLQAALDAKVSTGSAATVSSLTVGASASTTGIIYLGQNQTAPAYLYWNGGSYAMPSGPLLVNGSQVWTAATFNPASYSLTSHVHDWSVITGKPSTFAPSAHGHAYSEITSAPLYAIGASAASLRLQDQSSAVRMFLHSDSDGNQGFLTSNGSDWIARFGTGVASFMSANMTAGGHTVWHGGNLWPVSVNGAAQDISSRKRFTSSAGTVAGDFHANSYVNSALEVFNGDGNRGAYMSFHITGIAGIKFGLNTNAWLATDAAGMTINGNTVHHAGNFNPADKANASHSHDWAQVTGKPALLSQVATIDYTALDTAPAYGITTVGYPGYSKTLLAFNPGGSTGNVQQEFFYQSGGTGFWRVRNKLDSTTWQPWKHVMLHDDAQAPISGTVYTSTNLTTSVPALEAQLFNNGGVTHGTTPAGFGGRFFYNTGPNSSQAYGMTLGLGSNYASTSYSMSLAVPRKGHTSEGYLHYQYTENSGVDAWAKIKAGYADSAGSLVGFDPATKSSVGHGHAMSDITGLGDALTARDTAINLRAPKASPVFSGDVVIANGNNKVIFHQPSNDAFYIAPSTNDGTDWLWSQQLMYDRVNARWNFNNLLYCQGYAVHHAGNFNPATKANLSGATFTGDVWTNGGASFKVLEANASRANQVYLGADGDGGYIHSTYGSGGTSAFRVICEGSQRVHVNTTRTFVEGQLRTPRVQYDTVRSGAVGIYDAAQTQAVWAMGPDYVLNPSGASNVIGSLYGLAWSYEPNYGGSGNNPQSKPELYHQLLLMQNGVTSFAAGVGIWTSGRIECAGNGGWTMGSYANKNRIDYDGSKFRFINSGNANASVEMSGLTTHGTVTHNSLVSFAQGSVTVGGDGLMYNSNWYRSTGQTGWFNDTYSTGIYSTQGGEVRTYNGSRFHSEGKITAAGVIVASVEGFQSASYIDGRNRVWSFENADAYGLSYMRGSQGWSGQDTFSMHFGTATDAGGLHKFRADGVAAHAGDLYVKGTRLPVFTSSTGAPSGGTDGDIHVTY